MELSFDELLKKANEFTKSNVGWHFHMLAKDCVFNDFQGKFCLIVENEESKEDFVSLFDSKPLAEAEDLVKIAYKRGFLNTKDTAEASNKVKEITNRAKELNEQGIAWHHHHLAPNCKFNELKGNHILVLEDKPNNKIWKAMMVNPEIELNEIERLFYKK